MREYDFVAIGGGNAGLTAVGRIAGAGHRTALIDRGPIGGLCSLNGCNPKKVLVRSTELLDEIRHAAKFGIEVAEPRIDWSRVIDRKESFTGGVTAARFKGRRALSRLTSWKSEASACRLNRSSSRQAPLRAR